MHVSMCSTCAESYSVHNACSPLVYSAVAAERQLWHLRADGLYVCLRACLPARLPASSPAWLAACLLAGNANQSEAAAAQQLTQLSLLAIAALCCTHREHHLLCGIIKTNAVSETTLSLPVIQWARLCTSTWL
jgi:hypothetical protein